MSKVNLDEASINSIVIQIEMTVQQKREVLDGLKSKYDSFETYESVVKAKDFTRLYGNCVDDYGKLGAILSEVSEALMDIRTIRKALRTAGIPATVDKTIRNSLDYNTDILTDFKEAVVAMRESLSARLRFYNSCQYSLIDKVFGDKC